MTDILQHPYAQAFARALLHFLWQGALIGAVGFMLLRVLRLSAAARYTTGVALLAAMLAAPAVTTWYFVREASIAGQTIAANAPASKVDPVSDALPASAPTPASAAAAIQPAATPVVSPAVVLALWLTGVIVLSIRLVGGWIVARRMTRRAIHLASPEVQGLARRVAGRLALDRVVRIVESSRIAVPVMVGWIKPVVILPTAALAGLTPLQVEALLAHELAHIRRHDYLVNLLQSAVETVLFYHPAVWWVSSEVRAAREQCCDDLAVGICDRLVYATALAELAAMTNVPRLALAAADGSLVERVRRVLGHPIRPRDARTAWLPLAIIAVVLGGWMPSALTSAATDQSGVTAGVQTGVTGGVQTGVARGVAAGVPDGVPGGAPGGVSSGVSGGVTGGVPVGVVTTLVSRPAQEQSVGRTENAEAVRYDMLKQLLEHARQTYDNAKKMVEIGTMAGVDVRDVEATIARLEVEIEVAAIDKQRASEKALSDSEAALAKQRFVQAVRELENMERRFVVGVATVRSVDEALLAAMEVAKKATRDQEAAAASEQSAADQTAQVEADLTRLQQQVEETQKALVRTKELVAQRLASQAEIDRLSAQLAALQMKLKSAQSEKNIPAEKLNKLAAEKAHQDEYQVELAKVSVQEAEMKLSRVRQLAEQGVVSTQQVQEAELALARAKAEFQKPIYTKLESVFLSAPATALRDRILREGATMSDDALIGVLKDAAKLSGDTDRAEVLLAFARQQTMTPEMATLYVAAAGGIKSDDERARVFKQPVRLRQGKGK